MISLITLTYSTNMAMSSRDSRSLADWQNGISPSGPSQIGGCCNVNHPPISFRSQGDQPSRQSHSGPQAGAGNYWEDFNQNNPSIITIKNTMAGPNKLQIN